MGDFGKMYKAVLLAALPFILLACAGGDGGKPARVERQAGKSVRAAALPEEGVAHAGGGVLYPYPDTDQFLQCVPFARAVSGIEIRGDAWSWWDTAAGRYGRGHTPAVGAVLVFKKTARMKRGHVSVVVKIQDSRHILVSHANWGDRPDTRGVIHERMPVSDVSAKNDWSEIISMNRYGGYGGPLPAYGFIYQNRHVAGSIPQYP